VVMVMVVTSSSSSSLSFTAVRTRQAGRERERAVRCTGIPSSTVITTLCSCSAFKAARARRGSPPLLSLTHTRSSSTSVPLAHAHATEASGWVPQAEGRKGGVRETRNPSSDSEEGGGGSIHGDGAAWKTTTSSSCFLLR
jgi:hypothetical protein